MKALQTRQPDVMPSKSEPKSKQNRSTTTGRAAFMTDAMWFAWLLRPDVRQGASIGNKAAQREFVAWWLLDGPGEFPGAFMGDSLADTDVMQVAMEPVQIRPGFRLPRLLRGLYRRRDDLRSTYPLHDLESLFELLTWYRVHGAAELTLAPALADSFSCHTDAPSLRLPWTEEGTRVARMAVRLHGDQANLQEQFDPATHLGRRGLAAWYDANGMPPAPARPPRLSRTRSIATKATGVNLVGYPRGEFGIGEDIRMLAQALDAAGIAYAVHDLQRGCSARQADDSLSHRITSAWPYAVDILCQTAFDTARCGLEGRLAGTSQRRRGRYRIGYWPWELQRFPAFWRDAYNLVDEVWAASRFTFEAYQADHPPGVYLMPPAVALEPGLGPRMRRTEADSSPYVFLCAFDPNSLAARKNPGAAVRAFQCAFAHEDQSVRLVLRVNGSLHGRPEFAALIETAAADARCTVEQGTLSRADYQRRISQADCFISPHRAEGFGRNIAEAILLGVQVLATGVSGCMDFLEPDERLAWSPRAVCQGEYPFAEGMTWAEPDMASMVNGMRRVRAAPGPNADRLLRLSARYNPAVAGTRVAARLEAIFSGLDLRRKDVLF